MIIMTDDTIRTLVDKIEDLLLTEAADIDNGIDLFGAVPFPVEIKLKFTRVNDRDYSVHLRVEYWGLERRSRKEM